MRTQYDTPLSPLRPMVAAALAEGTEADPTYITLVEEGASARIRLYGGHLVTARVTNLATRRPQELLYPGEQDMTLDRLKEPKLRASHFGAPAGRDGFGVGNKHGIIRFAPHDVIKRSGPHALLRARLGEVGIAVSREVMLAEDGVIISDVFANMRAHDTEETSFLSHLYLWRGRQLVSADTPITINGRTLDRVVGEDGAAQKIIEEGKPYFWRGFADVDSATVSMPDGSSIDVHAQYNGRDVDGALLWAPPGVNAFCLEPVVGFTPENNRGCVIPAGELGELAVSVFAATPRRQ